MRNITLNYCVVKSVLYADVLVKIYTGHLVVELLMLEWTITLKAVTTLAYSSLWLGVCVSKLLVTLWPFSFWPCGCQTSANMQVQFIVSYCSAMFFICSRSISFSWNTAHWLSSCLVLGQLQTLSTIQCSDVWEKCQVYHLTNFQASVIWSMQCFLCSLLAHVTKPLLAHSRNIPFCTVDDRLFQCSFHPSTHCDWHPLILTSTFEP